MRYNPVVTPLNQVHITRSQQFVVGRILVERLGVLFVGLFVLLCCLEARSFSCFNADERSRHRSAANFSQLIRVEECTASVAKGMASVASVWYFISGGWKCAIVGVPWRGSVSACLAWGDLFVKHMFEKVLKRLSLLRHHGTPMMAHLQPPDLRFVRCRKPHTKLIGAESGRFMHVPAPAHCGSVGSSESGVRYDLIRQLSV